MKTSKHTNSELKLHELNNQKLKEIHSDELGLNVPEDYFSKSKKEILSKVLDKKEPMIISIYRKRSTWLVAATVALIFGITIFKPFSILNFDSSPIAVTDTIDPLLKNNMVVADSPAVYQNDKPADLVSRKELGEKEKSKVSKQDENDIVVESLFIEDKEINECVNNYMLEDI